MKDSKRKHRRLVCAAVLPERLPRNRTQVSAGEPPERLMCSLLSCSIVPVIAFQELHLGHVALLISAAVQAAPFILERVIYWRPPRGDYGEAVAVPVMEGSVVTTAHEADSWRGSGCRKTPRTHANTHTHTLCFLNILKDDHAVT